MTRQDYFALFDRGVERRGTGSYKWDSGNTEALPMWVADMDFATAPAVIEALHRRVDMGAFGYTYVGDDYYDAVIDWFRRRHGWNIAKESIVPTTGVVPAISAVIKALTKPGDKVIVQTPVYNCFFSSIRNNGCIVLPNPLLRENGSYRMDFADLEAKAADPLARVLILCNPANPAGRAWTREELARLGEICLANGVTVLSDEIHCELVMPGHVYTPFATVSRELAHKSVVCVSPSKAFNTAGLQIANIVAPDQEHRRAIDRAININEVVDVNPFGVVGTIAAYTHGGEWLDALIEYIWQNYLFMKDFCERELPQFPLTKLEATYLVWMDCRAAGLPSDALAEELIAKAGLWLNAGTMYGPEGRDYIRWNLACPRRLLKEGLERFAAFFK